MTRWLLVAAVSAALAGCAAVQLPQQAGATAAAQLPAGVTLVETYTPKAGEIGIPYRKYRLANGLTVLLHEDHSDPLVKVDITYHVGSDRELPGRTGFAHLFEHMMFQGSEHVADEQHFKVVTEAGGELNGTTNSDRTNYFETVPSNQLEKMLWLESDRMGYLLPALTEQKFEVQRATVKNERAQRIDNRPYGRMNERFEQAFYPVGHPYSWPVIGWPEDLDRTTAQDVKDFFRRWYGPNNATLTIGGDIDVNQTLTWVNKYFSDIPRGPDVTPLAKPLVTLDKTRYVSMEDNIHLPLIQIGFPTVYARHKDEAPLDLLANILGGGKTSILYKNLVKDGYAVQAGASHPCQELSCKLTVYALANPAKGSALAPIEKLIRQSIDEFETRGVTDEDLQKVKIQFRAHSIFSLQSVSGKVSSLAANQTFTGNPNQIGNDLARYDAVTKDDVMRVFREYVRGKPSVVISVVPKGGEALVAAADNFTPTKPAIADKAVMGLSAAALPEHSSFDRNVMPLAAKAPVLKVPELWDAKLTDHIAIMGTQSTETPTTELIVYLNGGHRLEPLNKSGLAALTADMLNESSAKRSSEDLAQALELLGSSVSFSASDYQSVIRVTSLTENLDKTIAIVKERLLEPGFKDTDFNRVKQQTLQTLQHMASDPNYLANEGFSKLLFGSDNSLGISSGGTLQTVAGITLADVKAFYAEQYRAGNAQMVTVTDLPEAQLLAKLQPLTAWQGTAMSLPAAGSLPESHPGVVFLIDKPGAAQSVISIGKRALPYDATGDFFKTYLMNYPLGGAFNSRINLNLREDKGYTYGARSFFAGGSELGYFEATASVRTDVTDKALAEFMKEISHYYANGMTPDEQAFMRASISQGKALDYETPYQKAGFIRMIQKYQLPHDFTAEQDKIIAQISIEQLNQLAKQWLDPASMQMLVVGDKSKIEAGLQALGYKVVNLPL
ncbi:pitrilysin family protein [Shewanella sp. A32]|uniref:M16 family metallopeptidase n=1 Tax=Shewanella sp. A32 TaxID=3031327 RepID=UPI0023B9E9DA|nr:pitrilysin family protein [Shewanella sp. A32]MDF0534779.1 pitrilysin family protein [Shewanella sp. A32]